MSIRDIEPGDAALINRYWAESDASDLLRLGDLARPNAAESTAFIHALCRKRPAPHKAEESILIWCLDTREIGISTLKEIRFQSDAQIYLQRIGTKIKRKLQSISSLHSGGIRIALSNHMSPVSRKIMKNLSQSWSGFPSGTVPELP